MAQLLREEPPIHRVGSLRRKASSVPATPSTPIVSELVNFQDGGYKFVKNSKISCKFVSSEIILCTFNLVYLSINK